MKLYLTTPIQGELGRWYKWLCTLQPVLMKSALSMSADSLPRSCFTESLHSPQSQMSITSTSDLDFKPSSPQNRIGIINFNVIVVPDVLT